MTLEETKVVIKKEFADRKKTEPDLKLSNVYEDVSKRAGHKDWNTYCASLKRKEAV